jgi:hypothetical protein
VVGVLLVASACVMAPTPPPPPAADTVPVRVEVFRYGENENPLQGASVSVDQEVVGVTGADGLATVQVERGVPVTIAVFLAGYRGFSAEGTVWGSSESWRFWLEQQVPGSITPADAFARDCSRFQRQGVDGTSC